MALGLGLGLPFRRSVGYDFVPSQLFAAGEQGAWYDPSDLATLFQDSAGTTAVTAAGQPVGLMLDKSGRGNHARQTTAAARPLYQLDAGKPYLAFDGVDDWMVTSAFAWGSDEAFLGLAVRKLVDGAVRVVAEFSDNSSIAGSTNLGAFGARAPAGAQDYSVNSRGTASASPAHLSVVPSGPAPTTNVLTSTNDISADLTTTRLDGVAGPAAVGDKGAGNFGTYPLYIGARGGTSLIFNGRIYGAIFRNLNPNATTISAVEWYLAGKSGVVLP